MKKDKEPRKQFRGTWARAELFDAVESEEINYRDAWLLLLIDSLVKSTGKECFASNEWFQKRMGNLALRQIQESISKLKKLGLVKVTGFDGRRRLLITCWSILTRFSTKNESVVRVSTTPTCGNPHPRHAENVHSKKNSTALESAPRVASKESGLLPIMVDDQDNKRCLAGTRDKLWGISSKREWEVLRDELVATVNSIPGWRVARNSKLDHWTHSIAKIHTVDGYSPKEVTERLKWYCKAILRERVPGVAPLYLPDIQSGSAFRAKWSKVGSAMHRAGVQSQKLTTQSPKVHFTRPNSTKNSYVDDA